MRQHPCPVCGRMVDPATTPAMPFCSDRCRQIDLARWLGERYRVPGPVRPLEEALEESSPEELPAGGAPGSDDLESHEQEPADSEA